jgi:hypothetical protein
MRAMVGTPKRNGQLAQRLCTGVLAFALLKLADEGQRHAS